MRTIGILTVAGLAVFIAGCGSDSPAVNKVAIEKSVTDAEKGILKALNDKDANTVVSNYVADAVLMVPGEPAMKGQDAMRAGLKELVGDPNFKIDFASDRVEVSDSGDMAATRGSYTLTVSNPSTKQPMDDKGTYVTVFRKQKDGAWKAVFDINTSDVPPAPPPAPRAAGKKKVVKRGKKR